MNIITPDLAIIWASRGQDFAQQQMLAILIPSLAFVLFCAVVYGVFRLAAFLVELASDGLARLWQHWQNLPFWASISLAFGLGLLSSQLPLGALFRALFESPALFKIYESISIAVFVVVFVVLVWISVRLLLMLLEMLFESALPSFASWCRTIEDKGKGG